MTEDEGKTKWRRLSSDEKIRALALGPRTPAICPACKRTIETVYGYYTQHTDPSSWGNRRLRQCVLELTPVGKIQS